MEDLGPEMLLGRPLLQNQVWGTFELQNDGLDALPEASARPRIQEDQCGAQKIDILPHYCLIVVRQEIVATFFVNFNS